MRLFGSVMSIVLNFGFVDFRLHAIIVVSSMARLIVFL